MLRQAVASMLATYRHHPQALASALEALVATEIEKRRGEDEQALAARLCEKKHPTGPSGLYCRDCHEAEMEQLQPDLARAIRDEF